ncbi:DUF2848 family protein [Nocardia sp. NPDC051981]|uniref:DUF2848 family protein n=1 Tax=Nocardia sp. NPDC051981 TaxID=3155417 RepID=UPI00343B7A14
MTTGITQLRLRTNSGDEVAFTPTNVIVAGYTGRDTAAVAHHVDELAAIGVPRPDSIPAFYEIGADTVTTDTVIEVDGPSTSGEVEPVLIYADHRYYLTVGSDHTDRVLETQSIRLSKAACLKPIATTIIDLGTDPSVLRWDEITVSSWVNGDIYQRGSLASMLPLSELLSKWGKHDRDESALVLFGGTMPLVEGTFRYGHHWQMSLEVPGHAPIEFTYNVTVRSS